MSKFFETAVTKAAKVVSNFIDCTYSINVQEEGSCHAVKIDFLTKEEEKIIFSFYKEYSSNDLIMMDTSYLKLTYYSEIVAEILMQKPLYTNLDRVKTINENVKNKLSKKNIGASDVYISQFDNEICICTKLTENEETYDIDVISLEAIDVIELTDKQLFEKIRKAYYTECY